MKDIYMVTVTSNKKTVIKQDAFLTIEAARKELAKQFKVESMCNAHFGRKPITDTLKYDFFLYEGPSGKRQWKCEIETVKLHEA